MSEPDLAYEKGLLDDGAVTVAGLDEVGRGALAGPVVVGAVLIDARCGAPPPGLRDSKALSARQRSRLCPAIRNWSRASALGSASAAEIDRMGITAALGLAAWRAVWGLPIVPDAVLIDGPVDVLACQPTGERSDAAIPQVHTRVGADRDCASVAAASVLAKVARDAHMVRLAHDCPSYGWAENKGYGTPAHRAAIAVHGVSPEHRTTWRLLTRAAEDDVAASEAGR